MAPFLLAGYASAWAQLLSPDYTNPRASIRTHLEYAASTQPGHDLSATAAFSFPPSYTEPQRRDVSRKMKRLLDLLGYSLELQNITDDPNYTDTITGVKSLRPFKALPEIEIEKRGWVWRYSTRTVEAVPAIYARYFPWGADWLERNMSPGMQAPMFGTVKRWQVLSLLLACLAGMGLYFLLVVLLRWPINAISHRFEGRHTDKRLVLAKVRPVSLMGVLYVLRDFVLPMLLLPPGYYRFLLPGLTGAIAISWVIVAYRATDLLRSYLLRATRRTDSAMDDKLVLLTLRLLKILIIVIGGIYVLARLDYDVTALLAGLSLGGLAVALAAQDTLKNFFGSIIVFLDKPFRVGDWIKFEDKEGVVEDIGLRATRVRSFTDSLFYVPNHLLVEKTVDNFGLRNYRRYRCWLGIQYNTPPDLIEAFVGGCQQLALAHPQVVKDMVNIHFHELGDFSLKIFVNVFFDVPTFTDELNARHELNMSFVRLAHHLGVQYAFPTQTLHVASMAQTVPPPPEANAPRQVLLERTALFAHNYFGTASDMPPATRQLKDADDD